MDNKIYTLPFKLETIGETPRQPKVERQTGLLSHQFIWIKKGEGKFVIEGKTLFLGEGEGMFMRRGIPHSYSSSGGSFHTVWCTFSDDDRLVNYSIGDKNYMVFIVPGHIETEFRMLRETANSNVTPFRLSAAGYEFACVLFESITKRRDDIIGKARTYMENNCHLPITLDAIAAQVGLDRYSLCRYFKKNYGKTVMEELLDIRISKAKRYLRYSSLNIEAIALSCGFESPSYLCLRFREKCTCTPSQYRKR